MFESTVSGSNRGRAKDNAEAQSARRGAEEASHLGGVNERDCADRSWSWLRRAEQAPLPQKPNEQRRPRRRVLGREPEVGAEAAERGIGERDRSVVEVGEVTDDG